MWILGSRLALLLCRPDGGPTTDGGEPTGPRSAWHHCTARSETKHDIALCLQTRSRRGAHTPQRAHTIPPTVRPALVGWWGGSQRSPQRDDTQCCSLLQICSGFCFPFVCSPHTGVLRCHRFSKTLHRSLGPWTGMVPPQGLSRLASLSGDRGSATRVRGRPEDAWKLTTCCSEELIQQQQLPSSLFGATHSQTCWFRGPAEAAPALDGRTSRKRLTDPPHACACWGCPFFGFWSFSTSLAYQPQSEIHHHQAIRGIELAHTHAHTTWGPGVRHFFALGAVAHTLCCAVLLLGCCFFRPREDGGRRGERD